MIYPVLLLALTFRLILSHQSFWLDEAASLSIARLPLPQLFSAITNDFHPPLYYLLLHFWLQLGLTQEWFLRLPSILFGVASVYFLFLITQTLKTKRTSSLPIIAALLLAINPLHVYYSQELRMYSLNILLSILSWYFLLKHRSTGFLVTTILNIYTFYGSFFNLFAQFIYLLLFNRKWLKTYLITSLLSAVAFIPWIPILQKQLAGGQYLVQQLPSWASLSGSLSLKSILLIPLKFSLGRLNLSTNKLYLLTAASASLYFFSLILIGLRHKLARPFISWLSIPFILALLVSLTTPILGYWRFLYLLPAFVTLIALGISLLPHRLKIINLVVVVITLVLANTLFWLNSSSWREDWKTALTFVQQNSSSSSLSLFAFSDAFAPVKWYGPNLDYAAPLSHLTSDPAQLDLALSQATLNRNTVFFFEYLSPLTDPSKNIATWLENAGYSIQATHDFRGVGFIRVYTSPHK